MKVKSLLRSAALLLALLLCLSLLGGCSSKGKTLMTLEKDGVSVSLSVNTYELMLSMVLMVEMGISTEDIHRELASRHVIDHKVKQEKMV